MAWVQASAATRFKILDIAYGQLPCSFLIVEVSNFYLLLDLLIAIKPKAD